MTVFRVAPSAQPRGELLHVVLWGEPVALCGRQVSVDAPVTRRRVCATCARRAVVCPECGGPVDVDDVGRVEPHTVWRMGRVGLFRSGRPCAGVGMPADREAVTC